MLSDIPVPHSAGCALIEAVRSQLQDFDGAAVYCVCPLAASSTGVVQAIQLQEAALSTACFNYLQVGA